MEKETKQIHKYWLEHFARESIAVFRQINRFNDGETDFGKQGDNGLRISLNDCACEARLKSKMSLMEEKQENVIFRSIASYFT